MELTHVRNEHFNFHDRDPFFLFCLDFFFFLGSRGSSWLPSTCFFSDVSFCQPYQKMWNERYRRHTWEQVPLFPNWENFHFTVLLPRPVLSGSSSQISQESQFPWGARAPWKFPVQRRHAPDDLSAILNVPQRRGHDHEPSMHRSNIGSETAFSV